MLFGSVGHQSWANAYLVINYNSPQVYIPLFVIEGVVFAIGCVIFLLGLITLVKGRLQGKKIIKTGIYRYIRHPQNLGILLMIFPFTLLLPFRTIDGYWRDPGIRTGDILSWILMVALIVISSLIEERLLTNKLHNDAGIYLHYKSYTGMMIPKVLKSRFNRQIALWQQILIVACIYGLVVLSCFLLQRILSNLGLVVWIRTL